MWHSKLKYKRINILINASQKWLKIVLALKIKKLNLAFLIPKLEKFPIFDTFIDLANF